MDYEMLSTFSARKQKSKQPIEILSYFYLTIRMNANSHCTLGKFIDWDGHMKARSHL